MVNEQVRVHIRWMIRRDMPEVLGIEQESFEYAWTEEDFLRCLRQRNCIGMVAEQSDQVVGFMVYELLKGRLRVINFAVHPSCRRHRVGSQMVAKLISKLSSHRRTRITLVVREANPTARPFLLSRKFYDAGRLLAYNLNPVGNSVRDRLIDALEADPEDWDGYLVTADYLEENGEGWLADALRAAGERTASPLQRYGESFLEAALREVDEHVAS